MLQPARQKFRKEHRALGAFSGKSYQGALVSFGMYGLKAQTGGELTSREIEAARRAMTRYVKRGGKIWIRIFPHSPITKKPAEVPMGSGKGSVEFFVARVKPGRVLFEIDGVTEAIAREAFRLADSKLGIKTKFITRYN
jgi:large subunit ribosomal protein L16